MCCNKRVKKTAVLLAPGGAPVTMKHQKNYCIFESTILIEINNKHKNYVEMIKALGFNLSGQYQRNNHEFNYIFTQ